MEDQDKIIPFPDQMTEIVLEADSKNDWQENFSKMIKDANLPEVPANIHNIKNGTVIKQAESENITTLFYDGKYIRAGGIDSPYGWTLENLISDINNGKWEVVGEI